MATNPPDQNPREDEALNLPEGEINVPVEDGYAEEEMEVEVPRRAASAEFIVDADVGSEAALREAMDPANQSLAEALRLSFRVLQVVMVILLVLFAVSGFTTIDEDQTGVKVLFGRIVTADGQGALTPGAEFNLPYPAGEFVIIDASGSVNLRTQFETPIPGTMTREQAIQQRTVNQPLRPGMEGTVITTDGGLAHLRVDTTFVVEMPVALLNTIKWEDLQDLVRLSVQHAVVKVSGQSTLDDLTERSAAVAEEMRLAAQSRLDDLGAGIRLSNLTFPDRPTPPLAIEKSNADLADARERANNQIAQARQEAVSILIEAAGPEYQKLVDRINAYEEAIRLGDEALQEQRLAAINEQLVAEETSGAVVDILSPARDHGSQIALTLGNEAQQFESLFPAFQQNPGLVVRELWLDAYQAVMAAPGVEIYQVPAGLQVMRLDLYGSDAVMNERRDRRLEMARNEAIQSEMMQQNVFQSGLRNSRRTMSSTGDLEAGRMLDVQGGQIQTGGN